MKVLITGISGKIARIVAEQLLDRGHQVAGVDRRAWPGAPEGVVVHEADVRKRATEDAFRTFRPDAVVHMATVTHLGYTSEDRYRINLQGTRAVFDAAARHGVKRAVFVGRHTYYGAAPDSPLYHKEDEPPMAVATFPELADLVAADLYAGTALWRFPQVETVVMRLCYTLGPTGTGTLASFLRGKRVPVILGFDPLFQFVHEDDAARAIVLATESCPRGVFNVAGPPPLPLSLVVRLVGRAALAIPEPLFRLALGRFGFPKLPPGALEHIKYPVVVDGSAFREATGFVSQIDETETAESFRRAVPPR
jgi:UDP-glucose 4-epimerase